MNKLFFMAKTEVKRIDLEKGVFTANGKTYRIEGNLSIERYAMYAIYEKELAYGLTVKGMYDQLKNVLKLLDKTRFVDSAVLIHDMIRGVSKLEEREPIVLKICALYCNTEDEDRSTINEDMITKKISDWKTEGLDMRDFFQLASSSVNGFIEIYRSVTQGIMAQESNGAAASR